MRDRLMELLLEYGISVERAEVIIKAHIRKCRRQSVWISEKRREIRSMDRALKV